jgi:hypothetical protein
MKLIKKCALVMLLGGAALMLSGCLAEVGSERWCQNMRDKPKTDWTLSEGVDFTKHCIIK